MRDYTFNGTPVGQMSIEDIQDCLTGGIQIIFNEGDPDPVAKVFERLKLELFIRSLGLSTIRS